MTETPIETVSREPALMPQRQMLRRYRWFAGSLLGLAALTLGATHLLADAGIGIRLLRAAAEAALVGGLADWFAVTALFRRPLGLPIPHTAIIPRNKDRIGEGLGQFVAGNFLRPDLVAERLRRIDAAQRLGTWLSASRNADRLTGWMVKLVPQLLRSLEDRSLREFLYRALAEQTGSAAFGPAAARVLTLLIKGEPFALFLSEALQTARGYLLQQAFAIRIAVKERSSWWVPNKVDERIAEAIITGIGELLEELADPESSARRKLDAALAELVERLGTSQDFAGTMARLRADILRHEAVRHYAETVMEGFRRILLDDLMLPNSPLRTALAGSLSSIGTALQSDAAMRQQANDWIEAAAVGLVDPWRGQIGAFIADVVRGWDAAMVVDRIELAVGRDLQYIRINGTVVGALVGCLLFLLEHAFS
jgi:uncharacterized membrane-anchored protein YjiN (DUF445 family)